MMYHRLGIVILSILCGSVGFYKLFAMDLDEYSGTAEQIAHKINNHQRLSCKTGGQDFALPYPLKALFIEVVCQGKGDVRIFWDSMSEKARQKCYREKGGSGMLLKRDLEHGELIIARKWRVPQWFRGPFLEVLQEIFPG